GPSGAAAVHTRLRLSDDPPDRALRPGTVRERHGSRCRDGTRAGSQQRHDRRGGTRGDVGRGGRSAADEPIECRGVPLSMQTNGGGAAAQELSPLKKAFLAIDRLQARVRELEDGRQEPIAVVGLACRFPGGASSPERYAELLRDSV